MIQVYIVWFLFVIFINTLASIKAKQNAERYYEDAYVSLPDITHRNLPKIYPMFPDYLLLFLLINSIYSVYTNNHNNLYLELNSLLTSLSIRPIFIISTTLPACIDRPNRNRIVSLYERVFLSTHDLMFSGHTCMFIFYGKLLGGNIGFISQYIFPITILMARQHYTMDVLVSYFVYNYFHLYYQQNTQLAIKN